MKRMLWVVLGISGLVLIGLILLPIIENEETITLDQSVRDSSGEKFVQLSDGFVHYELTGEEGSPVIVLVHGFSAPMYIWDGAVDYFTEKGFRVLRFDLFGRGLSDRPDVPYDLDLYVRQLDELLVALELEERAHLVGLSYSGPIVARFASIFPERVRSLTLIDPMAAAVTSNEIMPMNLPLIGEYITAVYLAPVYLPEAQGNDLKYPERYPDWEERYREQLVYKGFRRAILSSTREMLDFDPLVEYAGAGGSGVPVLLIWGEDDHLIPEERILNVKQALGEVEFHVIPDAGHLPFLDQPDMVFDILLHFLME